MAEQDAHQPTAVVKPEETQSTYTNNASAIGGCKEEEAKIDQNVKQHLSEVKIFKQASSSSSTNSETKTDKGEDLEQAGVKKRDSAEEKRVSHAEGHSSPDDASTHNVKGDSTPPQAEGGGHGDNRGRQGNEDPTTKRKEIPKRDSAEEKRVSHAEGPSSPDDASTHNVKGDSTPPQAEGGGHGDNRGRQGNEDPTTKRKEIPREYHTGDNKAPETITPPSTGERKDDDDEVDGPKARLHEETPGTNNTNAKALDDDGSGLVKVLAPEAKKGIEEEPTFPQTPSPQQISVEEESDEDRNNVETIDPTPQETTDPIVPVVTGGSRSYLIWGLVLVVVAILVPFLFQSESPPQKNDMEEKIDIFTREMEKVKTQFPNQRAELWNRSKIHLLRHLQTAQPTEPVSLILTAGLRAEKTLHCLARALASAFSSALNASVLHIDGVSKASQDSDQVKLEIDTKLQGAFEGDKPVAVIHRFEELPPGSTLIFYRYCDHENAAYKKTCLMFTVLLEEKEEIPANSHLSFVEEMVDDHLQKKFLSDGHPVSFDRMDLDKYGGLWSRISHLILPVAAEERIDHEGC